MGGRLPCIGVHAHPVNCPRTMLLQELRREIELMDGRGMKQEGPRLVARCWTDPAFKDRLLQVTGRRQTNLV